MSATGCSSRSAGCGGLQTVWKLTVSVDCESCWPGRRRGQPFHSERLVNVDISRFTEADLPSLPIMTRPI